MADIGRRAALGALGGAALSSPLWAQQLVDLGFKGGGGRLPLVDNFPEKAAMLRQRSRGPLLETPFEVFDVGDRGVFTPNDRFFVRWHYADIPLSVDVAAFRLKISGAVRQPLALTLGELLKLPRVEIAAVNQCSGNSRGHFSPRVPGGQWGHGAMGNARWTGVRLKDVLDRAGIAPGASAVRFAGLDRPPIEGAPWFAKSLAVDHARDGEVMIAFAMNGEALPMLNGFPIRLVVPGWYSTYWVKALDRIEVLSAPDDNFWMAKAYQIPATPRASVAPGDKDFPTVPISTMVPRSFITNRRDGSTLAAGAPLALRGIALGGASGVARVELTRDSGRSWQTARLDRDEGKYSFRAWRLDLGPLPRGEHVIGVRCTASDGQTQLPGPIWNGGGYMYSPIETIRVRAA
ncbi:MAG: oxidase [Sphingomonas sp. 28-62-20]|uniref:molybdopterin-dependent oxidoreductase n=1 Tax=Sphingomonas sp. 28-62-20 TaxID=1970433 RepID=UPI000BDBD336|nr:MAG: oxidase [Sphingomonas sp. 28-62-20]